MSKPGCYSSEHSASWRWIHQQNDRAYPGSGKTVAVAGNEFYVNAAEGADAKEADADVVIQVAVPAQTTVELCSTEAQAILSKENCIAIFGSNQVAAEGVLAANANLNVLVLTQQQVMLSVLVSMLVYH